MRRSFVRWPTFQFCRVLFTEVNFLAPVRLIVQRIQRPGPAQKTRTYRGRSTNHLLKCLKGVLGTLRIIIFQLAVQSGFSCATKPWKLAGGGHQHYLLKTSSSRRRQAWRNFRSIIKILLRDTVHNLHSTQCMYVPSCKNAGFQKPKFQPTLNSIAKNDYHIIRLQFNSCPCTSHRVSSCSLGKRCDSFDCSYSCSQAVFKNLRGDRWNCSCKPLSWAPAAVSDALSILVGERPE